MPASGQNTVTPVSRSPLMSAQLTALPPRYFGSSAGGKQILPGRGSCRSGSGAATPPHPRQTRAGPAGGTPSSTDGSVWARGRRAGGPRRAPGGDLVVHRRWLVARGLAARDAALDRELLHGIRSAAAIGRAVDRDDVIATVDEPAQHLLRERCLPEQDDPQSHATSSRGA